jgi:diguanylate cyclase (GGDEF)-like protein
MSAVKRGTSKAGAGESTERDAAAEVRDQISDDRDAAAEKRDVMATERDLAGSGPDQGHGLGASSPPNERTTAQGDRMSSADDRLHSAEDREAAAADRSLSAAYSDSLLLDDLTGVYRRGAGVLELERELKKARRTNEPCALAFIDVDHLKETNDAFGHGAGDQLLRRVADAIRSAVREYDVVMRYGGDEFLCGTLGLDMNEARTRFDTLNDCLAATGGGTASVGVIRIEPGEGIDHAIARADAAMYEEKTRNAAASNVAASTQAGHADAQ